MSTKLHKDTIQVRLPSGLHRLLKIYAAQEGLKMSTVLGRALTSYFEKIEWIKRVSKIQEMSQYEYEPYIDL